MKNVSHDFRVFREPLDRVMLGERLKRGLLVLGLLACYCEKKKQPGDLTEKILYLANVGFFGFVAVFDLPRLAKIEVKIPGN